MANNQCVEPSIEMSDSSFDSDCYIVSGSDSDDTGSEAAEVMSPMPYGDSDDEMSEMSEMEYGSSIGEAVQVISSDEEENGNSDVVQAEQVMGSQGADQMSEEDDDFGPEVPDKIIWGKPMFSKRVLQVRRAAERAWRIRNAARTVNWGAIVKSKGYQMVKAACQKVQKDMQ